MKRLLSITTLLLFAVVIFAEVNIGGINYQYSNTGLIVREGPYKGFINIPSYVQDGGKTRRVTCIGSGAFSGCTELTGVNIPSTVTSIESRAFSGCTGLTSISIPSSVTSISSSAFNGCSGLMSIDVDAGNSKYDNRDNCNAIIETSTNTLIAGCKHTIIPNSVTSIESRAFFGCSGLTSITIPSNVTSIGENAFSGTAWYGNQPDGLVYAGNVAYEYKGTMPEKISIKDGTLGIADYAFDGCTDLTSITIPSSVTSIGRGAFSGTAWYDNQPDGLVYAGNVAYTYKGTMPSGTSITLEEGTTGIADYAFYDRSGLMSVTIPSSVTSIGSEAFRMCTGLTSITIPETVMKIGEYAFYNCSGLTSINVDKNSLSLLKLWNQSRTSSTYIRDYLYDTGTGEKIEMVETTASSIKVFNPEPKNYTITSQSLTFNGKSAKLPYNVKGLAPNKTMGDMVLTIEYKDNQGEGYKFIAKETTVKTQELTLTTEQPKVVSMGNVIVSATTNVDAEEKNVGFEWRRTDWTSDFASNSGNAVIFDNTMEGYIRNLNTDKLWTYRAYYISDAGVYYYGDWVGLDASNTSYFEPTVHTYADISTTGNVALIRGYVLNGTDKIKVQGFKYWKTANKGNSLDIDMEGDMQTTAIPADAIIKTVDIVGSGQQLMNATLEGLDYDATYHCVAFATTTENETFYGEEQMFTTESITGIEGVKESAAGSSKAVTVVAYYDLNGKRLSQPQKGLNIIRMSDGTTRKVVR